MLFLHGLQDAFTSQKVTENDFVTFVAGPAGSDKGWFTEELCVDLSLKNDPESNKIVIVDTPSFHTGLDDFDAEEITTTRIELRFVDRCRGSGILFLHPPMHSDVSMARHLYRLATTFPRGFAMASLVYVVPTQEPRAVLTDTEVNQRLSQLKSAMTSLSDNGNGKWFASMFTEVLRGQPDTAWKAVQLLLKGVDSLEFFAFPRPASNCMPSKSSDARLAMKFSSNLFSKQFKEKGRNRELDVMITRGRTALEFTSPEHPQHHSTPVRLTGLLPERFNKEEGSKEILDELITLKRAEAEHMSPDKPQRQSLLLELGDYFAERFKRTDSALDLEEIIFLRGAALERIPPPNRCKALLSLAEALHEKFQIQGTENSLAEAVSLARSASGLSLQGIQVIRCIDVILQISSQRLG
ncbi:hypothetical protein PISMIDRAFT_16684 [Pisolithus microcarpus 441]|uniref:Uncharacterized protein n=1 Tax=Pisolithus microcarpus 441 TaxID=765257 RepID=A0A0C9YEZ8_9AGAM|nr:hypothetical protein PISMIDRAFT_16684 [Pisolithus microcarpus 441]